MKKLTKTLLIALLGIGAVGCETFPTGSTNTGSTVLEGDALILDELVARVVIPEHNTEIMNNFTLPATVKFENNVGEITWVSDSGYVIISNNKTTVESAGVSREVYNATVVRPESGKGDATVKLTATVTFNGKTATKTQKVTVQQNTAATEDTWGTFSAPVDTLKISTWEEWTKQESGTIAVKGIITGYVYQEKYTNSNVFLQDANGGYYAYAVGDMDDKEAANYLAVGNEVIFEGEKSVYHGLHEFNQEKVTGIKVLSRGNTVAATDVTEAATKGELTRYQAMYVKATGMLVEENSKKYFQFGQYKYEMYHDVKYSGTYYNVVEEQLKSISVGDTVVITGFVGSYDADQFHPINLEKVEGVEVTPTQKIAIASSSVDAVLSTHNGKKFREETVINLYKSTDSSVTIEYSLDSNADTSVYGLASDTLTINPSDELKEATLTVTITCETETKTNTYTFSAQKAQAPATPVSEYNLTVDTLGLTSQSYNTGTATIEGVDFEYIQLGNYGNGIQMRDKDGKTSKLWNTTPFAKGIERIEITYSSTQSVTHSNPDAQIYRFGNGVDSYTYETKLSTEAGVKTYTITPDVNTYTYFQLEHDLGYSFYFDSIKICFTEAGTTPENPGETPDNPGDTPSTPVSESNLTVDTLGLTSQSYNTGTATIDGVDYEYIQLGNYGNGIQMRDKDGKTSKLWNTTAFAKGIERIEITYSSTQSVTYSNPDAQIYRFGNGVDSYTYETKLSTTAGVKTYTITPDVNTYTYFQLEHDLGYSFYFDSIKICFAQ